MGTGELNCWGDGLASHPGRGGDGVEILLVASCYRSRDKPRPDGALGSYIDLKLTYAKHKL